MLHWGEILISIFLFYKFISSQYIWQGYIWQHDCAQLFSFYYMSSSTGQKLNFSDCEKTPLLKLRYIFHATYTQLQRIILVVICFLSNSLTKMQTSMQFFDTSYLSYKNSILCGLASIPQLFYSLKVVFLHN